MGKAGRTVWKLWHLFSSALQSAPGQVTGHPCVGLYAGIFSRLCAEASKDRVTASFVLARMPRNTMWRRVNSG